MTYCFLCIIHKESTSDYGISFPDVPGCISAASTADDILNMASEALSFHLDGLQEIPRPSETVSRHRLDGAIFAFPLEISLQDQ